MTIELLTQEEYNMLISIQKEHPNLTFQNQGYQYVDKSKFTEADKIAFDKVTNLLRKNIKGFIEFNNFKIGTDKISKAKEVCLRFQYNWGADTAGVHFTGVGYLTLREFLNGFDENKIDKNDV